MEAYCDETGRSYWPLRRWRLKFGEELGIAIRRRPGAVLGKEIHRLARAGAFHR
jgi:hypothetical protein